MQLWIYFLLSQKNSIHKLYIRNTVPSIFYFFSRNTVLSIFYFFSAKPHYLLGSEKNSIKIFYFKTYLLLLE